MLVLDNSKDEEKKMADAIDTLKMLGSLLGNGAVSKGSGGNVLANTLGSLLGGDKQSSGGLGDLLGGLLGGQQAQGSSGGLGDLLGGLLGGKQGQGSSGGGGLSDLLKGGNSKSGGLGGLMEAALRQYQQSQDTKAPDTSHDHCDHLPMGASHQDASNEAELLIRAMINAAKADGSIDQTEQDKIVSKLGDISSAERQFLRQEFAARLNVKDFINTVPRGIEQQVYAVSLMAIDLDTNPEAHYLHELAQGLGISKDMSNRIHAKVGAPKIYG